MTEALPPALRKALDLFTEAPANPDVSKGYLDLLGAGDGATTPQNTGTIQKVWASTVGSLFYDNAQALARRLSTAWQHPQDWLNLPRGGVALDVGSGPGNVTATLADAVGPDGLALGLDISEPMLARAVRSNSKPQLGFMRADAQRLPLRDETVDAIVSIAVLQLVPDPSAAVAEMARVLRPGGRLAIMVPTVGHPGPFWRLIPNTGARFFTDDELADILEEQGFQSVRTKNAGPLQWVRGKKG